MTVQRMLLTCAVALLTARSIDAQSTTHRTQAPLSRDAIEFLQQVHASAEHFQDRRTAIAEGYRRLGPDFPAMGEHWVHPGLIVSGQIDARRPAALCYTTIEGKITLVAVAFTLPLSPGQSAPGFPAPDIWHDHTDRIDEESLLLIHAPTHRHTTNEPRMAMFHAWLQPDNPDGPFAQNNWRLPFARLGLHTTAAVTPTAGKALSLVTSGPEYYLALFDAALGEVTTPPDDVVALRRGLEVARADVQAWLKDFNARSVAADDLAALESIWTSLWTSLERQITPATWQALVRLR